MKWVTDGNRKPHILTINVKETAGDKMRLDRALSPIVTVSD